MVSIFILSPFTFCFVVGPVVEQRTSQQLNGKSRPFLPAPIHHLSTPLLESERSASHLQSPENTQTSSYDIEPSLSKTIKHVSIAGTTSFCCD
jgi:hypothetical protein